LGTSLFSEVTPPKTESRLTRNLKKYGENKLLEAKRQHAAILLISEDLDEVLSLSDRVAPIYEGEFMGIIPIHDARIEDIGAMMAGLKHKVAQP